LRQHQFSDADVGGEDRGRDALECGADQVTFAEVDRGP
jgi:hypothetical protein